MRGFIVLGMTFIMLLNLPGWATATTVQFDDNLKQYMQGTMNACAWAFTKAHKKSIGSGWTIGDDEAHTPANAMCKTDGVSKAQSTPQNAVHTHAPTNDEIRASADAKCDTPSCSSFTTHNTVTVVTKPHSVAAATYARGGVPGNSNFRETGTGALRGPTVSITGKVTLSAGTDPYESLFALAITDQALNEWNHELATLLGITDPPILPGKRCMAPPEDSASAKKHCSDPKNLQEIQFQVPHTTYFKIVVKLNVNGQLDVQTSGTGKIVPPITKQDFDVKSVPCAILHMVAQGNEQECFFASLKGTGLNHEIRLMGPPSGEYREYPAQFAIDEIHGIVAHPPFE